MKKKLVDRDSQIDTQAWYTLDVQRHPFNVPFGEVSTRWKYVHLSNSLVLPPLSPVLLLDRPSHMIKIIKMHEFHIPRIFIFILKLVSNFIKVT